MKTYLLDDDEIQLLYLQNKLQAFTDIVIVGKNTNATIAKNEIENLQPQLLFLDIDLITVNGLDLYRSLHHKPILILATSLLDYALDGYELDAVDYLVKPYTTERLEKAIAKANTYFDAKNKGNNSVELQGEYMFVKDGSSLVKIKFIDVLFIEALGDFCEIHLVNNTKKVTLVNLKNIDAQLPSTQFLRISRTTIVNVKAVDAIANGSVTIAAKELGIGKSYLDIVMHAVTANQVIKRNI